RDAGGDAKPEDLAAIDHGGRATWPLLVLQGWVPAPIAPPHCRERGRNFGFRARHAMRGLPVQQEPNERATRTMTKRAESKYKINRRLGVNLWGRPKSPVNKRDYGPGQHGQRRKKATDYGTQLAAKQKLRSYYGNIS